MELSVAIRLIEKGVDKRSSRQIWADLGAGKGLFTQALASLLGAESTIFAVDKDAGALKAMEVKGAVEVKKLKKDFTQEDLDLEQLDGIIMANSIHYVADKLFFIKRLKANLKIAGNLIVVEYNMETSNPWVPYPVNFKALQKLGDKAGFKSVTMIGDAPSVYNQATIYSALLIP